MLEYFLILVFFALMAKGGKRKFNLRRVRISSTSAAGALAAADVVSNAVTDTVKDPMRFISVKAAYSWTDIGAIIDDGCTFGLAHSDYTAAEVEEAIEAGGSMDLGDKLAQEKANRLVRTIGTISQAGALAAAAGAQFNDGRVNTTRLNWLMSTGDTLNLWVRNSSGVVWTTGSGVTIEGNLWVKDAS